MCVPHPGSTIYLSGCPVPQLSYAAAGALHQLNILHDCVMVMMKAEKFFNKAGAVGVYSANHVGGDADGTHPGIIIPPGPDDL